MNPRTLPAPPAFIVPLRAEISVDGVDLVVTAMDVEQIALVLGCIGSALDELTLLDSGTFERLGLGEPSMDDLAELMRVLQRHGQSAFDLVAIGTRTERAWAGHLLPDRLAYLFALVVTVNADFFSRARPGFAAARALLSQARLDTQPAAVESTGLASSTA